MAAEDSQSFVAQRYFYRSAQLPLPDPFFERNYTWQHAYDQRHRMWLDALQARAIRCSAACTLRRWQSCELS